MTLKTILCFVFGIRRAIFLVQKVFGMPVARAMFIKVNSLPIAVLVESRFSKVRDKCS